jgi:hypothetical protein
MYKKSIIEDKSNEFNDFEFSENIVHSLLIELANIEYERYKELKMKANDERIVGFHSIKCFNISYNFYQIKVA